MADNSTTTPPLQPEPEPAGFWLPSEFFTDDDFLPDNHPSPLTATHSPSDFSMPSHFNYNSNQNLNKNIWGMSTSPKSTLSLGSPSGTPSSPTTPFGAENDLVEELIHKAAGQVAMLKLSGNGGGGLGFGPGSGSGQTRWFPQQPKCPSPVFPNTQIQRQMYQNRGEMGARKMGPGRPAAAAWTNGQSPVQIRDGSGRRGVVLGKRACAGTGVFLPRARHESSSTRNGSDYRRKQQQMTAGGSTTLATDRAVVAHALDKSFDTTTCFGRSPSLSRMPLDARFIQNYDLLMARRHALMLHQQRNLLLAERSAMISRDMYLPQEWTY